MGPAGSLDGDPARGGEGEGGDNEGEEEDPLERPCRPGWGSAWIPRDHRTSREITGSGVQVVHHPPLPVIPRDYGVLPPPESPGGEITGSPRSGVAGASRDAPRAPGPSG